jgi:hypothetical protein
MDEYLIIQLPLNAQDIARLEALLANAGAFVVATLNVPSPYGSSAITGSWAMMRLVVRRTASRRTRCWLRNASKESRRARPETGGRAGATIAIKQEPLDDSRGVVL